MCKFCVTYIHLLTDVNESVIFILELLKPRYLIVWPRYSNLLL